MSEDETELLHAYDERLQMAFLSAYIRNDKRIGMSCADVGITYNIFRAWVKNDPKFRDMLHVANEEYIAELKAVVYRAAKSGADPRFTMEVIEKEDLKWDQKFRVALAQRPFGGGTEFPALEDVPDPFGTEGSNETVSVAGGQVSPKDPK